MKASAIHTYAGGFVLGLRQAGIKVDGSYETYKAPMRIASALEIPNLTGVPVKATDVVIANPPCSRFSAMSVGTFTVKERRLEAFCELNEVFQFALEADASVVWWESGPLAISIGKDTLVDCHKFWEEKWQQDVTTVIVSLDLLYTGWPQRRPRTHVFHFKGNVPVVGMPASRWELTRPSLKSWLKATATNGEPVVPFYKSFGGFIENPRDWTAYEYLRKGGFKATLPVLYTNQSLSSMSMIGARNYGWYEENRWWSIYEYMQVMGYPQDVDYYAIEPDVTKNWYVHGIGGKSVSPCASEYLTKNLLIPMFNRDDTKGVVSAVPMSTPGMFYFDLRVKRYTSVTWKPQQADYVHFERVKKCS